MTIENKARFDELFEKINRPGTIELYNYLSLATDFFLAPASSMYHLSFQGGLLQHSVNVAQTILKLNEVFATGFSESTLILCGLLHDICKANFYMRDFKNVKVDGVWIKQPCYSIKDVFPLGHGEKSVILLLEYIKLTPEEMLAIRWHMSKWELAEGQARTLNAAFEHTKLVSLLQLADEAATHIIEG